MPPLLAQIDWDSLLREDFGMIVVPLIMLTGTVGIVALAAIVTPQWRKAQQTRAEARLKERMVERGYSADEIIRVINAGVGRGRAKKPTDQRTCSELVTTC